MGHFRSCSLALLVAVLVACAPGLVGNSLAGKGQSTSTPSTTANTISSSATVDGMVGGTVRCGRWTVVVPPGAYSGAGTITISVPDKSATTCDLDIKPGGLNGFLVPVELSLSTQGLNVDPTTLTIYWYDPATGKWMDVHGTGDSGKQTLTAYLYHFSTYAAGKAGW